MTFDPYRQQQPQYPPPQAWPPRQPQPQYPPQQQMQVQPYYRQPYPQQWQQPAPYPQPAPAPVNAALIVILSFIIPGLGSIVGRSYVHGSIILAAFLLSAALILAGIGIFLVPITWIWGMIAACVLASRR